ncbi:CDP-alcohol phosphatidyltransferase family protein [Candidatus Saccharibacteria bacterium]|nr:CDP-alcohol phosphatidyltransferase family protein [Candidatus Saccharibacteria bacterium]
MDFVIEPVRKTVKSFMNRVAKDLDKLSGGKITPNFVTITGLLAHIPIAWLVATQEYMLAAVLLIIFGLFDTLDGALARQQKRESNAGMLLDASTDRFKEVLLYTGAAYSFIGTEFQYFAVWAVAACGASLSVSYVKAKGETAIAKSKLKTTEVNRKFQDGFLRFEVRMSLFVIGLIFNILPFIILVIAILSAYTAIDRLIKISKKI